MSHPYKHKAHESSRNKFKTIHGHAGGGHAHSGSSHLKRADVHGEQEVWNGHKKAWIHPEMKAHGGKSKKRLDKHPRYADGGKVHKHKGKGDVNVAILMHPGNQQPQARPIPIPIKPPIGAGAPQRPPVPGGGAPGGMPPGAPGAGGAGPMPPMGGMPPRKRGGRTVYARGGKIHPDEKEDKHLVKKMVKSSALKRADGGRADSRDEKGDFIPGESNKENLRNWQGYASRNSFASGGHVYPKFEAGACSGVGRLEKAKDEKHRR